jgi:pimeloyl-ACP methyl ester carboxylesterase
MENQRARWAGMGLVSAMVALGTVGMSLAWAQPPAAKGKAAAKANPKGKNTTQRKAPNAADKLVAKDAPGTYHFRLKVHAFDDTPLVVSYYPAIKLDTTTPVVLLIHEKDRSSKDFEDPISELKGIGLAEHLQSVGYAVLALDLRGYGANPRKAMTDRDWRAMVDDLQAAYQFLVDRHNRGELNVAKLGVIGMGEGANLVAAWAEQPGGAVSSEGRTTDLSGMALISPLAQGEGYPLTTLMGTLAPRVPILLAAGERDAPSHEAVKRARPAVEKTRQNKVELFPSSLHGYKLLRLEPRATSVIARFLEGTVKLKSSEWEPRYNLTPVSYTDIQVVRHVKPGDEKAKAKEKEKEKEAPKAKEPEKEQPKDVPKAKGDEPPPPPKPERKAAGS